MAHQQFFSLPKILQLGKITNEMLVGGLGRVRRPTFVTAVDRYKRKPSSRLWFFSLTFPSRMFRDLAKGCTYFQKRWDATNETIWGKYNHAGVDTLCCGAESLGEQGPPADGKQTYSKICHTARAVPSRLKPATCTFPKKYLFVMF